MNIHWGERARKPEYKKAATGTYVGQMQEYNYTQRGTTTRIFTLRLVESAHIPVVD